MYSKGWSRKAVLESAQSYVFNGEWRMANGEWRMQNAEWRMENGEWRI